MLFRSYPDIRALILGSFLGCLGCHFGVCFGVLLEGGWGKEWHNWSAASNRKPLCLCGSRPIPNQSMWNPRCNALSPCCCLQRSAQKLNQFCTLCVTSFRPTVVCTGLPKANQFCSLCVIPFRQMVACTGLRTMSIKMACGT